MKARFTKRVKRPNPLFKYEEWAACQAAGTLYEHPVDIEVEPGLVIEHPRAWRACLPGFLNAEPVAEPYDEACRIRVEFEMAKFKKRVDAIPRVFLQRMPEDEDAMWRLKDLSIAYDRYDGEFE